VREVGRVELAAPGARALVWVGSELFDVAAGWTHHRLDGSTPRRRYAGYGPGFDTALTAPTGDVVALLTGTGTKGLLFDAGGELIREVDRSFYHADAYRYPLALFTLPDGRTGVVHCPQAYNRLEIEDARAGERLTASGGREPQDFFHSRLAVSPSGRYLLSAGWVWHPWGCLAVFDLHAALADPRTLDSGEGDLFGMRGVVQAEISGACFVGDDVVVSTSAEPNEPDGPDDLGPNMLARWSMTQRRFVWRHHLTEPAGDLLPAGNGVLSLYRHPRLYDADTGLACAQWPDLSTGEADSSIVWSNAFSGPARAAVDPDGRRFAVTDGDRIVVVELG
jgi:hypothetical protein